MTLSDYAALGSLISGVAVLISLVFVAIQLRASIRNQQSLVNLGRTQLLNDWVTSCTPPERASIELRGNRGEKLSPEEFLIYVNFVWMSMIAHEMNFLQHRAGHLSDEQFEATLGTLKFQVLIPGHRAFWMSMGKDYFEKHFVAFVDDLIARYPAVENSQGLAHEAWQAEVARQVAGAR